MRVRPKLDLRCRRGSRASFREWLGGRAFTLLEVLIAMGLFFLAVFAILDCTMQGLRAARALERNAPDVGLVAWQLMVTNRLEMDSAQGDFEAPYEGFRWEWDRREERTNGLYSFDLTISGAVDGRPYESKARLLLWRPQWSLKTPGVRP